MNEPTWPNIIWRLASKQEKGKSTPGTTNALAQQQQHNNNIKTSTHPMHALGIPSGPGVSHFSPQPGVRILEHLLLGGWVKSSCTSKNQNQCIVKCWVCTRAAVYSQRPRALSTCFTKCSWFIPKRCASVWRDLRSWLWGFPLSVSSTQAGGRRRSASGLESKSRACVVVTARGLVVEREKCVTGSAR